MADDPKQPKLIQIWHYLSNGILRVLARALKLLPYENRIHFGGWFGRNILGRVPFGRERVMNNIALILPHLTPHERKQLHIGASDNFGRIMVEQMMMDEVAADPTRFKISGPGLEALKTARDVGKGAIVVSAHYGNWEGYRVAARDQANLDIAAVYRAHNNPYYNDDFVTTLREISPHAFSKGRSGTRALVKHLKAGGIASILVDQKQSGAPQLDFMGQPAETALAAAKLAISLDIPLIPMLSLRDDNGISFSTLTAAPIPVSDDITMMQAVNDQLSKWILEKPEQWFWFHRRWR